MQENKHLGLNALGSSNCMMGQLFEYSSFSERETFTFCTDAVLLGCMLRWCVLLFAWTSSSGTLRKNRHYQNNWPENPHGEALAEFRTSDSDVSASFSEEGPDLPPDLPSSPPPPLPAEDPALNPHPGLDDPLPPPQQFSSFPPSSGSGDSPEGCIPSPVDAPPASQLVKFTTGAAAAPAAPALRTFRAAGDSASLGSLGSHGSGGENTRHSPTPTSDNASLNSESSLERLGLHSNATNPLDARYVAHPGSWCRLADGPKFTHYHPVKMRSISGYFPKLTLLCSFKCVNFVFL